jgi:hypothetical protein
MSKPLWVCIICGEDFTRKSSGKRHRDNSNIHNERPVIVRYIEYIIGRARFYTVQKAELTIRMVHYYVFNLRDESLLDSHLKSLRYIERTMSR